MAVVVLLGPCSGQVYEKVLSFTEAFENGPPVRLNQGEYPGRLIEGTDGHFFGDTGGLSPTLFKVSPEGVLTTLVRIGGPAPMLAGSSAELKLEGFDGNYYGVTPDGGTGAGSIFRMTRFGEVTTLVGFSGIGSGANRGSEPEILFQANNGSFYGSTRSGGQNGLGTIFRMSASGGHTVLVDFSGSSGTQRGSGLVTFFQADDGSFYGITAGGGLNGHGTIFKMSAGGVYTVLHDLTGPSGVHRGASPAFLIPAREGKLFGLTASGGSQGFGTIFRIDIATGAHQVMADLGEGYSNALAFFEKPDGNLLVVRGEGEEAWASYFTAGAAGGLSSVVNIGGFEDLGERLRSIMMSREGDLYGASFSNEDSNFGDLFRLSPTGVFTPIHRFTGDVVDNDGLSPGYLVQGRDGAIYGTTDGGGAGEPGLFNGRGTIFRITPADAFEKLVDFGLPSYPELPSSPHAAVIQGRDGNFYGTSRNGGSDNLGTVYSLSPAGGMSWVKSFTGNNFQYRPPGPFDGIFPLSELMQTAGGDFLGVTSYADGNIDAIHDAVLFKITDQGLPTILDRNLYGSRGEFLYSYGVAGGLIRTGDGLVFGVTPNGALRISSTGVAEDFSGFPGGEASLVAGSDATGPCFFGGSGNRIYKIRPDGSSQIFAHLPASAGLSLTSTSSWQAIPIGSKTGSFTVSFDFTPEQAAMDGVVGLSLGAADAYPDLACSIRVFTNNVFQAYNGGAGVYTAGESISYFPGQTYRVVMTVDLANKTYSVKVDNRTLAQNYAFRSSQATVAALDHVSFRRESGSHVVSGVTDGSFGEIVGGLVVGSDGYLYGTTADGGSSGDGTAFKVSPGGLVSKLADFSGAGPANRGRRPVAALVEFGNGIFYGTTSRGGSNDLGTVFRMTSAGSLTTVFEFDAVEADSIPLGRLVAGADGNLYGTTSGNEAVGGRGSVYRLVFDGAPAIYPLAGSPQSLDSYQIRGQFNPRGAVASAFLEYWRDQDPTPVSVPLNLSFGGYKTREYGTVLNGLQAGTTYHYRLKATNLRGTTFSPAASFSTSGVPSVALADASGLTSTTAVLHATVNARNADTEVVFEYGFDGVDFPGSTAKTIVTGNTDKAVQATVSGLTPGVTCHVRVRATNAAGTAVDGTRTFTSLIAPVAEVGSASLVSTTRALVEGTVNPQGATASVFFDYREKGSVSFATETAVPSAVSGGVAVPVNVVLRNLDQGKTYEYRVRATTPDGSGGTLTGASGLREFTLSILSGLVAQFPELPPVTDGTMTVNFDPPDKGAWRFAGERLWRPSGVVAGNLAGGIRIVEFLPVPGFIHPPEEAVEVTNGGNLVLARSYFETPVSGTGSLTVRLTPESVAGPSEPDAARAEWRFPGEAGWRSGGSTAGGLPAGTYLVECKPVVRPLDARVTPPVASVTVGAGEERELTLTYFRANDSGLPAPQVVDFGVSSADEDLPFAHVGQIRSNLGSSTGFVVKRRVVATAGHVVFDDGTLTYITELQWLFQRHAGAYEPVPQVPRGYYLAAGYANQRALDASPGEGSPESQDLDYAALYFASEAGRGGYGGFLATEAGDANEFLDSTAEKILAGYAVDGTPAADQGKLHATSAFTTPLSPAFGETWTSNAARGLGGCSGGPLFVRHANGIYYPAAIYLGGSGQTVVRAIDGDVVELFLRAETSANGGGNNTSGGITHTAAFPLGTESKKGSIQVIIEPAAARQLAASWWTLRGPTLSDTKFKSGGRWLGLGAGIYRLELATLPGFDAPPELTVEAKADFATSYTFTYSAALSPLEAWRQANFGSSGNEGAGADGADPDRDGASNLDEYVAGTDPNNAGDVLRVSSATRNPGDFTVQAAGKAGRLYVLERRTDLSAGSWTNVDAEGPLPGSGPLILSDPAPPVGRAFYRIRVSIP